ncbi:hypothetical protein [Romboutsia lituseburensis]|uniref:hypothetical protein n=1 Tax=Romboutsia lituseburensis TaxID=1537 RepID=UPI00215AE98C|nr:hypothetical protein [Romboutsia lituseburensis]MCR8744886.1 hypothetical protein [Romboutsia lituseburensis]
MDRFLCTLLFLAMGICMISFDIFYKSHEMIFVILSVIGIVFSAIMLLLNNKKYLSSKFKK